MIPLADFLQLDLPALTVGVLSALCCGLLGNFLVLRRQSLVGDAMSHVALPGIVLGFLLTGTTASWAMVAGATAAAVLAVLLIELIVALARVERGAAMGVVFTAMFATGVVLLEQSGARNVHIDVQHSLYGNIEGTVWLGAESLAAFLDAGQLARLPESIPRLLVVTLLVVALIILFFKELKVTTFDPDLADSLGIPSRWMSFGLALMVAVAAVAAFEAVGSILVIAMFVCPAATARMLTDDLRRQLWLSALAAVLAGLLGYLLAAFGPFWLGFDSSLSAAGMIAVVAGLLQALAMLAAPRYGVLPRHWRRRRARRGMRSENTA
ncbi:MAG TPA: iron chelate uptake ABC transporter family permease subunit [Geminicoccaceae bacterium]|nr:iron chelate uptake ABC transporter family permease subunit [Geminicoccaceae bacterium]